MGSNEARAKEGKGNKLRLETEGLPLKNAWQRCFFFSLSFRT
jgi:hypothetical protein